LFVGASFGAALAALVIATGVWPPSSHAQPLRLPRLSFRDNKQHLSARETATLLRWAHKYRACAMRHGLPLAPPVRGTNEIVITGADRSRISPRAFRRVVLPCDSELGVPPPASAFALRPDRWLHLYLPRTCLLPVVGPAQR
jgi:hypothetical protein